MSVFFINPFAFASADGDYESIATVSVGSGGATEMVFSSIPATYQHLQIRMIVRNNDGNVSTDDPVHLRFNGDTGSNYTRHFLNGNGSSAGAGASTSQTSSEAHGLAPKYGTQIYCGAVIDVLDYASTSKYKTIRTFLGYDANGAGTVALVSGLWMSTSAVDAIRLYTPSLTYKQHTTAALYGIKAP